jgi:excisionase family DNA binding protein
VGVDTGDRLLTPGEVAALFRVDPKTVTRWAAAGRIGSIRTPGGHRRFRESEVRALLEGGGDFDEDGPVAPAASAGTGPGGTGNRTTAGANDRRSHQSGYPNS